MGGRAKPQVDQKLVGVVLLGVAAVLTSSTTAECSVVWCSCGQL